MKELLQFCPCECSHEKAEPVCASDGITYDNKCRMTCSACKAGKKIEGRKKYKGWKNKFQGGKRKSRRGKNPAAKNQKDPNDVWSKSV